MDLAKLPVTATHPLIDHHATRLDTRALLAAEPRLIIGGTSDPDQPMTPTEFHMVRTRVLGLEVHELGLMLGLWDEADPDTKRRSNAKRRILRHEAGASRISEQMRERMEYLELVLTSMADDIADQLRASGATVLTIPTASGGPFPAGWWESVAREVSMRVGLLRIESGQ